MRNVDRGERGECDWTDKLTKSEWKALNAYSVAGSVKAAAIQLGLAEPTIEHHLKRVRDKIGVASTAMALQELADWKARQELSRMGPTGQPGPVDAPELLPGPRRHLSLVIALAGAAMVLAVSLALYQPDPPLRDPRIAPKGVTASDLAQQIQSLRSAQGSGVLDESERSVRRTRLVAELSDMCWAETWGPNESSLVAVVSGLEPDVRKAFEWACAHDHASAVRIIGNGHRVFYRAIGLSDWPAMVHRAMSLKDQAGTVFYGRTLCGCALADWSRNPREGFMAAEQAHRIFEGSPKFRSDDANALRHMGICSLDVRKMIPLYKRALAIYLELHDPRGIANCYLSLGQTLLGSKNRTEFLERVHDCLCAAEGFKALHNEYMLGEATEFLMLATRYPHWLDPISAKVRTALAQEAAIRLAQNDMPGRDRFLGECARLDAEGSRFTDLAADFEEVLVAGRQAPVVDKHFAMYAGFYLRLCRRIGRHPNQVIAARAVGHEGLARKGSRLSATEAAEQIAQLRE